MQDEKWEKVGEIGVDAGLCWVGDPCYVIRDPGDIPPRHKDLGDDWEGFCSQLQEKSPMEKGPTVAQFNYDKGHAGLGVAVSTGFGDGSYDVFVKYSDEGRWGKRIAAVKVVFIDDAEEEEE